METIPKLISKKNRIFIIFIILIGCVIGIGIIMQFSAAQGNFKPWASKQLIHLAIFLPITLTLSFTNINFMKQLAYGFYIFCIGLLIIVHFLGHNAMGAVRWLNLGFFKLQPSELMKIGVVLALTNYFHNLNSALINKLPYLIPPILLILLPVVLIMKQPDLGTASIILVVEILFQDLKLARLMMPVV